MRSKISLITALLLTLCWQQIALAAVQVQASVSDNTVFLGDRFTLTVSINDSDSGFQLDTQSLEKDFSVSSPRRSSNKSYVNGNWSAQTTWQFSLQAKRLGKLTIPALKVGDLSSEPINITVNEPSTQATNTAGDRIFIENSLDKNSVYIGQSMLLTSKIYIADKTTDLNLQAPSLAGATVEVYGEDNSSETIRNGIRYTIITRQYEINPSQAGAFTLASPLLTGNSWQDRFTSEAINIRGDSLAVTIKAKPQDYQGEWLVSEDVRLFEDPTIIDQDYRVGEPITRTITLQIASLDTKQLPSIDFNYPDDLRFYPDQDEFKEGQANNLHYAQRIQRHAIIADQAGTLTLPEIKLGWWNSQTNKQEYAILAAQTLTILPAQQSPSATPSVSAVASEPLPTGNTVVVDNSQLIIWQVISALLLLALIAVVLFHFFYRRSVSASSNSHQQPPQSAQQPYLQLQQALKNNQPAAVYQALMNYAQSEYPQLKSLLQLSQHIKLAEQEKTQLAAEIQRLEKACTQPATQWSPERLAALLNQHHHHQNHPEQHDIMDINPQ